jgi:phospholipid/cholesterol/gamma-HCH transport system substrate-binding protein
MLTRFVRIQLIIFTIASIIGVAVMVLNYIQAPTLLGIGRITVTLELPSTGALYRFSNVTYRGVQVGKVTAVTLTKNDIKATLSLGTSPNIPADLDAQVRSVSAVGEQYVDLRPRTVSAPFLRDGSVIPIRQATMPQPVGPVLDKTNALIKSIPKGKLSALLDESFRSLNGAGYDLGSMIDSSVKVAADANGVSDRTQTLFEDTGPLLDSQAQTAKSLRVWARSLAGVTQQLANDDIQVRTLLQNAPGAANEAARLLEEVKPTLPVLLANLTTIGQIGVIYHASLEQLLVLLPPAIAALQAALPSNNYIGLALGGFHNAFADPGPCTVGFLPPSSWRSPADTTTVDTPNGLYCKLPQDSPLAVRGARNYPCMGHPGKRAPTVEICDSEEPFAPLAMRQHFAGPYPLDPNLISQGIPPDDRVSVDRRLFAPIEGTPPGMPPPPSAAVPPPPAAPGSPALPPLLGGSGKPMSPPPMGPLAPIDTPDSAPATPPPASAPPGKPSAAPSSFGTNETPNVPSVAFAQYNPRDGSFVGSDGRVYRQSDLTEPSGTTAKTWRDLLAG